MHGEDARFYILRAGFVAADKQHPIFPPFL